MKKKIVTMALSVVLGLSLFGGVAQAKAALPASTHECPHTSKKFVTRTPQGYDPVSGAFHNKVYRNSYICNDCKETVYTYDYEWEDHTFLQSDAYGHWFCHYCGFVDDTYPN